MSSKSSILPNTRHTNETQRMTGGRAPHRAPPLIPGALNIADPALPSNVKWVSRQDKDILSQKSHPSQPAFFTFKGYVQNPLHVKPLGNMAAPSTHEIKLSEAQYVISVRATETSKYLMAASNIYRFAVGIISGDTATLDDFVSTEDTIRFTMPVFNSSFVAQPMPIVDIRGRIIPVDELDRRLPGSMVEVTFVLVHIYDDETAEDTFRGEPHCITYWG
ncbi:hypothetical protein BDN72DRAFT_858092 [Pluteus cervinus]|uniref:Uncharacterized protein n=1 Tax=Pluteus cervinus TaxID=181527 RepID=A0ACD3AU59_9AGAR|nr:hypothetical protein BDN72DRAFT_858092 [Pluteus cervinus]